MSTQLILYPQYYNGYVETVTNIYGANNEFMVDAIDFNTINASPTFETSTVAVQYLLDEAFAFQNAQTGGIAPNTWYRVRNTLAGAPDFPVEISNDLFIYANTGYGAGVYQKLSGINPSNFYDVTINMTDVAPTTGKTLEMYVYPGSLIGGSGTNYTSGYYPVPNPSTQETIQFSPIDPNGNDILVFILTSDVVGARTIHINDISCKESSAPIIGTTTDISDGQVICDLYEEEDIPLNLSIDDFKSVAEKVQSYSKDFNLPATKRNNLIFNNMFEITRSIDRTLIFNPYVRTRCVLKQDGFIIFEGYLKMIDIKDKEGEISYNVNLYSEVVTLADALKDRKFSDLDFTELVHDYERLEIVKSWNSTGAGITYINPSTSGFRDANDTVKYPFINWNNQISVSPNGPDLTGLETAFRPCIQLKYLIDRIFADTQFSYSSDFFNTADFKKLYMDFNWGSNASANDWSGWGQATSDITQSMATGTYANIITNTDFFPTQFGYSNTTGWTCQFNNADLFAWAYFEVNSTSAAADAEFHWRWLHTEAATGNTTVYNPDVNIFTAPDETYTIETSVNITMALNDTLQLQGKHEGPGGVFISNENHLAGTDVINQYRGNLNADVMTNSVILQTLRGELGQWEFLKGIFTMFNLITLADEQSDSNIIIEPYNDIFTSITKGTTLANRSIQHDWTDKVDVSQMELKPLTDLNKETIFKFVEDEDDYPFQVFKNAQSGYLYGSLEYDASAFTVLEGTKEIIAEPFAATVVKPLMSQYPDFIVPVMYAKGGDNTWEGFDNSPRIFYNNGIKTLSTCEYTVPSQNGVPSTDLSTFLQFSHLSQIPSISSSSIDFNFSSHQLASQGVGNPPINNLFYTYWQPYFNELYNPDTRTMTLKVNLNAADINTFKFTDLVMIKNRSFRVNKIEYKPNSLAKVEFILIG